MGSCKLKLFGISPFIRGDFVYENIDYAYRGDLFSASFIIENVSSENLFFKIEHSSIISSASCIPSDFISIKIVQKARGHIGRGYNRCLMPDFPKVELDDIIDYKSSARIKDNSSLRFFYYEIFPKMLNQAYIRRKKGLFTSLYTCTGEFPNLSFTPSLSMQLGSFFSLILLASMDS